ncbi:MAG: copper chaperone PCu(A)C [Rhodobacteraceae bacterium]|nr:copper chaperone PCu(A)C [Paracoccaceae bacterium]
MKILRTSLALITLLFGFAVQAGENHSHDHSTISVEDAYVRSSGASAMTGAGFMTIVNHGDENDRLIAVSTVVAKMAELHTHIEDANGMMMMRPVEGGFEVPAGGEHHLKRGGDHVMLMGLTTPLEQGDLVTIVLTFEKAGEVTVVVPVDQNRKPATTHSH